MTATKVRSEAWRRAMKAHRREALGMLDRIGPNTDHLPDAAQKTKHRKLTAALKRVVHVINQHLREARPDTPSPLPAAPGTVRIRDRGHRR